MYIIRLEFAWAMGRSIQVYRDGVSRLYSGGYSYSLFSGMLRCQEGAEARK